MTDDNSDELILELHGIDVVARRVDNVGVYAGGKLAHGASAADKFSMS